MGRKGRKWIADIPLKEGEVITTEGKIQTLAVQQPGTSRGTIRGRSPGLTPEAKKLGRQEQPEDLEVTEDEAEA